MPPLTSRDPDGSPGSSAQKPSGRVTLRDLAKEAGVAVSTVSMALRGDPSIATETRHLVEEVAHRLDYRPHPMLSALMQTRRTGRDLPGHLPIAFLNLFPVPAPWKSGLIIPALHDGMRSQAENHGYRLEEFWMKEPGTSERQIDRILEARGITAVIVGPTPSTHGRIRLRWERLSALTIGYSVASPALDRVISHHVHGMQIAFRQLKKRGFGRVGMAMLARENARVDWQWSAGYQAGAMWPGVTVCPPFLATDAQWKAAPFLEWFGAHLPEAIICVHPEKVLQWLGDAGVRVPEDVGLIDLYYREKFKDQFAAINHNVFQIGESAIDLLVNMVHHNRRGVPAVPRTLLIEPCWREGASLK